MQVTQSIHILRHPFTIRVAGNVAIERFVNTVIITGPAITLVDAGVAGSKERIFEYIRSIGRDPAEIALLVLTHSHPDHIGGALAIRKATGCRVAAHAAERAWIEDVNLQCTSRPVPGFHSLVQGPVPVGQLLEDGDVLELGAGHALDCLVLHVPGHSPGSIALFLKQEGVLLTGDAVPVPGDIPVYDDVLASVQSLKRLLLVDGVRVMLSSWDAPVAGICAYQKIRESMTYLEKVHTSVIRAAVSSPRDQDALMRRVAESLGLPPLAVTPMLARTVAAHLRLRDRPDLLFDENGSRPGGEAIQDRHGRQLLP